MLLTALLPAFGMVTAQGPAVVRLNPKLNSPYVYVTDLSISGDMGPAGDLSSDFHLEQAWTFDKKTEKGFHAIDKIVDATMTGPIGDQMPDIKGSEVEMEIDPLGKVLSAKTKSGKELGDISSAMAAGSGGYIGVLLPKDAPKVGLTWTYTLNLGEVAPQLKQMLGSTDATITFNCRISDIEGNLIWIDSTADKTFTVEQPVAMTGKMHMESESEVDSTDGTLSKMKLKTETEMSPAGMDVSIKMTGNIKRKSS